jgi:hypothetical protein
VIRLSGGPGLIGGFPAISIGCTHPIRFEQFEIGGKVIPGVGMINLMDDGLRIVLDGLGRITGALDHEEERTEEAKKAGRVRPDSDLVMPAVFYAPPRGEIDRA